MTAIQETVPVRVLPDHLIAIGEPVASLERISDLTGVTPRSLQAGLSRLHQQGRLFSPARGLYVAVPPEYRSWRAVPADWFVDALMEHLDRRYYVGLLSAAQVHGAAHQAPQVFQVMVDRQLADRQLGRVRLQFHLNSLLKHAGDFPTVRVTTHTGAMTVATPELTAVDLVGKPDVSGGLDNVATVLLELDELDIERVAAVGRNASRAVIRRLGWLLAHVVGRDDLELLAELAAAGDGDATPLDVHGRRAGPRDPTWGVIVNSDVEPDVS